MEAKPKPEAKSGGTAAPAGLKPGARGAGVKQLQENLVQTGHLKQSDMDTGPGIFGKRTEAALRNFQAQWNQVVDGIYGPKSAAAMTKALSGAKPPPAPKEIGRAHV